MLKITITGRRAEGKTTLASMIEETLKSRGIAFEREYGKKDVIRITDSRQMWYAIMMKGGSHGSNTKK